MVYNKLKVTSSIYSGLIIYPTHHPDVTEYAMGIKM